MVTLMLFYLASLVAAWCFGCWVGSRPKALAVRVLGAETDGWKLVHWEHNKRDYTLRVSTPAGPRTFRGSCTVWHDVDSENYDRPSTSVEKWLSNHWSRIQDTETER